MKTLSILLISLFSLSTNLYATVSEADSVVVEAQDDLYMLKVEKDLFGGQLVVTSSSGEVVSTMTIKRKRILINFEELKFGEYFVKIVKDGVEVEKYTYRKELIISQVIR